MILNYLYGDKRKRGFTRNNNRCTETYYYYDASNRLIIEKIANKINKFYYDSTGTLASIEIDGVMLFYVRDITMNI